MKGTIIVSNGEQNIIYIKINEVAYTGIYLHVQQTPNPSAQEPELVPLLSLHSWLEIN